MRARGTCDHTACPFPIQKREAQGSLHTFLSWGKKICLFFGSFFFFFKNKNPHLLPNYNFCLWLVGQYKDVRRK